MKKQDAFLRAGFVLFSAITSFIFVFYGVSVFTGGETSQWHRAFAYVVGGYGLANMYILSWAWRSQASWTLMANKVIAVCFLGVVVMDGLNEGIETGMEIVGMLGVAFVLGINWLAVQKLCQGDNS